jgi:hypothetical protein
MDLKHFGDSYDIVKQSLFRWLAKFGPWAAHPMFTHPVNEGQAADFARFLGVPLTSTSVLSQDVDRSTYLAECGNCRSIFLDPDTGVRLHRRELNRSTEFVFSEELVTLAKAKPTGLILVFDQSVPRGSEREQVQAKLNHMAGHGVAGFAYVSQACFLLLGDSLALVSAARSELLAISGLPEDRLLPVVPPNISLQPTAAGDIPSRHG